MRTTTTCRECGNEIPTSTTSNALCVECRYKKRNEPRPWDEPGRDGEPRRLAGFQIEKSQRAPMQECVALHNGRPMHDEPSAPFDWGAVPTATEHDPKEEKRSATEILARALAFIARDARSNDDIARRVRIASFFVRRECSQTELAAQLGVDQATVSRDLHKLSRELAGK